MKENTGQSRHPLVMMTVVSVVCIIGALLVFTIMNNDRITKQNRDYLHDNTALLAQSIDDEISDGYDNIIILSELVSKALTGPEFDITEIQGLIQNSVFDFMEFADRDGMDHNITGGVSDAHDRQYFLDAKNGNTGMELIYVSRATHETLLMFYSPIYYEDIFVGSLVGVYQASNRIAKILDTEFFGDSAISYLVSDTGRVIASNLDLDPQKETDINDLAEGDEKLSSLLLNALDSDQTVMFSLKENPTGGCMMSTENGWHVIQIFPQHAARVVISNANRLGYYLAAVMFVLYLAFLYVLIHFYRSQRKQVEAARIQAEVASQAKTSFLFNMSHDIRTPMNAILGYTDIAIRHGNDPERVRDSLKKIKSSGGHLLNLINEVLEMSRIESGRLELAENPMDLREAIESVKQMGQALAIPKSIGFEATVNDIRNPYVLFDELHLNQILINLISNAVKYTKVGGHIEFTSEQIDAPENGAVAFRFTVRDTGIGMSEEFQKHLFENFARENTATVSRQEGAGLGLAIVKRIVDAAGGSIAVQSEPEKGSVFTVELPMREMDEASKAAFTAVGQKSDIAKEHSLLERKRILLVEDNEMNREIATEILQDAGMIIETAEDGEIAVETVREKGASYYDCILMDIQMPVMDGYQATVAIRSLPDSGHVPIIALSANALQEDRAKAIASGMDAHIAKPIDVSMLLSTLERLTKTNN